MKSLSAAIVVLAGMFVFGISSLIEHDDTQIFYALVGAVVSALGLWFLFINLQKPEP